MSQVALLQIHQVSFSLQNTDTQEGQPYFFSSKSNNMKFMFDV